MVARPRVAPGDAEMCCGNSAALLHGMGGGTTQVLPTAKTHGSTSASFGLYIFIEEKDWV